MPVSTKFTLEQARALEEKLKEELIRRAIEQKVITSREEAVIRDIIPDVDLGATRNVWEQTLATADAYNDVYSVTLPDKKVIGFYGFKTKASTPVVTAVKFALGTGGAKVKDIWQVETAHTELNAEARAIVPIIYNKSETVTISMYNSGSAGATDNVILLGFVVEPKGELVTQ
ncbi:MAG: hypothetical protein DRP12_00020 [Candidatus Aenigmatarchaeota archaeon]|nr:MAG: hypothetical protein DRP12_00020 [Candidatus Aenigmarchaeota archaeon]